MGETYKIMSTQINTMQMQKNMVQ